MTEEDLGTKSSKKREKSGDEENQGEIREHGKEEEE